LMESIQGIVVGAKPLKTLVLMSMRDANHL